jgi:hypothetical protein
MIMKRLNSCGAMFILFLNLLIFFTTCVYADVAATPEVVNVSSPAIMIIGLIIVVICVASFLVIRWIKKKNDHH